MEKYARQAVSEGVKNSDDLHVLADSEIYRVLNLHYNRNNHIEVWGPQVRALVPCVPAHERNTQLHYYLLYQRTSHAFTNLTKTSTKTKNRN